MTQEPMKSHIRTGSNQTWFIMKEQSHPVQMRTTKCEESNPYATDHRHSVTYVYRFLSFSQIRNGRLTPDNVSCILPPRKGLNPLMYRFLVGCSTDWAFLPSTDVTDCYTSHFKAVDARVYIPRLVRGCKDHDPSRDQFLRRYYV